jgi:uncharacterized protein HemX
MAVGKSLDDLKNGPKEDKVAVASGIAFSVVVVLLVAWAIIFFHNIQQGTLQANLSAGAQDQFNFTSTTQAQQQLEQYYGSSTDQLTQLPGDAAQAQVGAQQQMQVQQPQGGTDQFGSPNTGN